MTTQTESKPPALRLIVTEEPRLCARRKAVHEGTVNGEVVDPFWQSVISLVEKIKSEYHRIIAERPCEGPTVKVNLPSGCTFDQIEQAFKMIQEHGWEIFPAMIHGSDQIYVRNYQC
ncbi:MAG: hypothetical protein K2Y39_11295 [Candidatus Obscuribacterales bacterium]|nr:hypothetical protein [Candidatus Obscuribacterales bacterium]